jgi:hypothetical protein
MSKNYVLAFVLILMTGGLSAQDAFSRIERRGSLRVGILEEGQYLFFERTGQGATGIEAYLSEKIASALSVRLEYLPFASDSEAVLALNRGEIDIFFGKHMANLTDSTKVFYTEPYAVLEIELLVNRRKYAQQISKGTLAETYAQGLLPVSLYDDFSFRDILSREYAFLEREWLQSHEAVWAALENGIGALVDEVKTQERFDQNPSLGLQYRIYPSGIQRSVVALISWREDWFLEWVNIMILGEGAPADLQRLNEINQQMKAATAE